jgi:hypothetical protein
MPEPPGAGMMGRSGRAADPSEPIRQERGRTVNQAKNPLTAATRSLTQLPTRRHVLRGLFGAGLGLGGAHLPDAAARKRRRPRFNHFGCIDVGEKCYGKDADCCSGICQGKKARSRCVAHDSGLCTLQQDSCEAGGGFVCDPNDKEDYFCVVTTGNAAFCGDFSEPPLAGLCRDCRRDRDCRGEFGPGAACIVLGDDCPEFCAATEGTACVPAAP